MSLPCSMGSGLPSNITRSSGSRRALSAMRRMTRSKMGLASAAASRTPPSDIALGSPPPSGICIIISLFLNDGYSDM